MMFFVGYLYHFNLLHCKSRYEYSS